MLNDLLNKKEALEKIYSLNFPFKVTEDNLCLAGYRGSKSHNTLIENGFDDLDIFGVVIAPIDYYLGMNEFEQIEHKEGKFDILVYDIRKFMRLLIKQNPNVVSWLWNIEDHYFWHSKEGQLLLNNRYKFLSKDLAKSFSGYAYGQLKKMTAFQKYEGYMGEKRKSLVDKFGYDVKNAHHLIRILKLAKEVFSEGKLNVYREHDRQELLDIKMGKWDIISIQDLAKKLSLEIDSLVENSTLQDKVDFNFANELLIKTIMREKDEPRN